MKITKLIEQVVEHLIEKGSGQVSIAKLDSYSYQLLNDECYKMWKNFNSDLKPKDVQVVKYTCNCGLELEIEEVKTIEREFILQIS